MYMYKKSKRIDLFPGFDTTLPSSSIFGGPPVNNLKSGSDFLNAFPSVCSHARV